MRQRCISEEDFSVWVHLLWTQNRKQIGHNNTRVDPDYGNRTEERQEALNYDYQNKL
jgi:hypothetical protein